MCLPLVVTQRNLLWYIVLIWGTWTRTFRSFPWINHNVILLQPAHTHNQEQQHNNIQHFFNIIYPAVNFPVIGKVESCKYFVWVWDTLAWSSSILTKLTVMNTGECDNPFQFSAFLWKSIDTLYYLPLKLGYIFQYRC